MDESMIIKRIWNEKSSQIIKIIGGNSDGNESDTEMKDQDRFLIWPADASKVRWDLLIMALSLFNCFSVPIEVAFEPPFL